MNNFDRLREQARREKNARMKEFQRLEKRRNDDEVRVQNKLDQLHQQELEEQRLKDQKIRVERKQRKVYVLKERSWKLKNLHNKHHYPS